MTVADEGPLEVCEVVYSAEMPGPRPPTLTERVTDIEKSLALGLHRRPTLRERLRANRISLASLIVGGLGVVVSYFAWWQPQQKQHADNDLAQQIDNRIEAKLKEHHFDDLVSNVNTMKGQMTEISGYLKIIVQSDLYRSAKLIPRDFERKLPEVKAALDIAKNEHVDLPATVVGGIGSNLIRSDQHEPQFWGAASALINYRSKEQAGALPMCFDKHPLYTSNTPNEFGARQQTFTMLPPVYRDCEIDLGATVPPRIFLAGQPPPSMEFIKCRVIYRGGDIPLLSQVPKLMFTESVFTVSVPVAPPGGGRNLISALLSSKDFLHVNLSGV